MRKVEVLPVGVVLVHLVAVVSVDVVGIGGVLLRECGGVGGVGWAGEGGGGGGGEIGLAGEKAYKFGGALGPATSPTLERVWIVECATVSMSALSLAQGMATRAAAVLRAAVAGTSSVCTAARSASMACSSARWRSVAAASLASRLVVNAGVDLAKGGDGRRWERGGGSAAGCVLFFHLGLKGRECISAF